ncbi:MAG: hypothetical protein IPF54_21110 [Draconibacterium sp.]|nr:hypothetical protein [Draconibacterium sp.]
MLQNITKYIFGILLVFAFTGFKITAQNSSKTQQQFQKAMQFFNLQEYQNAISEIEKILKKEPATVDALLLLSDIYHDSGLPQKEIETPGNLTSIFEKSANFLQIGKSKLLNWDL